MKSALTLLLLLLSAPQTFSQNYQPMAAEGAHWVMYQIGEHGPGHHLFKICGDTLIEGMAYKKMYRENLTSQATSSQEFQPPYFSDEIILLGAIRDDVPARQVFFYPFENLAFAHDTCEVFKDLLIHDFSKTVGDTLPGCLYGYPDAPATIMSIESEFLWGSDRKVSDCGGGARLVEGVGTELGPFYPVPFFVHPAKPQFLADYFVETGGECPPRIYSDSEERFLETEIQISPNPAHDFLRVKCRRPMPSSAELSLADFSGKTVWRENILPQAETTIPLQNLPTGAYLLTLKSDAFSFTKKVVKM